MKSTGGVMGSDCVVLFMLLSVWILIPPGPGGRKEALSGVTCSWTRIVVSRRDGDPRMPYSADDLWSTTLPILVIHDPPG